MEEMFDHSIVWWITAVEIPIFSGLFWMIWRTRTEFKALIDKLSEAHHAHKLEVAKYYASSSDVRDLEVRIVNHLLRIEAKLDKTALKTEALKAGKEHHDY